MIHRYHKIHLGYEEYYYYKVLDERKKQNASMNDIKGFKEMHKKKWITSKQHKFYSFVLLKKSHIF